MDKTQRWGIVAVLACVLATVAMLMFWPESGVDVDDNVQTRTVQRDEAPVLSKELSDRVVERHSGLLRVRTASGSLPGGVRWRFQADRPSDEALQLRDADGRAVSFGSEGAGGGDTLEFRVDGQATAKQAQTLARQVLADPKLEVVTQGRGRSRFIALSSAKLVVTSITLERGKIRFIGLFPRALCVQGEEKRPEDRYGITLACTVSPTPAR